MDFYRRFLFLRLLCLLALCSVVLCLVGCGPETLDQDIGQDRLSQASPVIQGDITVAQSFVATLPYLTAIEIRIVVPEEGLPVAAKLPLSLHLFEVDGATGAESLVRDSTLPTGNLRHNDFVRFTFAPLPDSKNRAYRFVLSAPAGNRLGVWISGLNAYDGGQLYQAGQPAAGDLVFHTFSRYDASQAASDSLIALVQGFPLWLGLLALLLLPGYAILSWCSPDYPAAPLARLALAGGLSLALLPLLLLWATTLGLSWAAPGIWFYLLLALLLWAIAQWRRGWPELALWRRDPERLWTLTGLVVLALVWASRYIQIRRLVVPAWVDAVHHTAITQIIMETGKVPQSFRPIMPVDRFFEHFGFHTLAAAYGWLVGATAPEAVLAAGQAVNILAVLAVGLLAWLLSGRSAGAVTAMVLAGLLSWMPAYYVTWGRYTQLAGQALVPAALLLCLVWIEHGNWRHGLLTILAAAGLFLVHYRAALFFVAFLGGILALWLIFTWRAGRIGKAIRAAAAGVATILLVSPWLWRLYQVAILPEAAQGSWQASETYSAVPWDLVWLWPNRWLIAGAICALVWAGLQFLPRQAAEARQRAWSAWGLLLGSGLLILLANLTLLGWANFRQLNNGSLVIMLYLPVCALCGYLVASLLKSWQTQDAAAWRVSQLPWAVLVLALALWGGGRMLGVVNPVTVLFYPEDGRAMAWIRLNLPPDARFLVNAAPWQEGVYMGADGGYWLTLLTGRLSSMPPALYYYGTPQYVAQVEALARATSQEKVDDPAFWQSIEAFGATYIYIGARGGNLTPEILLRSQRFIPVYSTGGVWIFRINPPS